MSCLSLTIPGHHVDRAEQEFRIWHYPTTSPARRRGRRDAPALGLTGFPRSSGACAVRAGRLKWRHALSLFGDIKYPADFKHFDYVNPDAPKGGVARQISIGTFDSFNIVVAGVKGSIAAGVAQIYETLMDQSLDEVVHRIRPAGRGGLPSRRFLLGDLPASQGSALARRQAGDAGRRDLLVRGAQEAQPAATRLLQSRREGREDRRARGQVHLRQPGQPRTAADRRPTDGAAETLVGRHRREGRKRDIPRRRWSRRSAPAPTASRNSSPAARSC